MAFRTGIDKVQEAIERSANRKGGINRRYFKWEGGEEKTIRFLTDGDEIVLVNMHEFVPTHDGGKRSFVCRQEVGEDCELCENPDVKKREVGYGIAIWREAVKENGKTVFKTKTETVEVEEDGKTVTKVVPWVGILQQAPRNFWAFFWAANDKYGTLKDRDYSVTRRGAQMDTTYQAFQEDPSPLDFEKFEEYRPDLEDMLTYLSSQEYYDKWLHGIEPERTGDAPAAPKAEPTDDDLARLKATNEELKASAVAGDFD